MNHETNSITLPGKSNLRGILLMLLSSLFVCFGQLLWKLSSQGSLLLLLLGFVLYAIGAMVMLVAYRFGSLSVLQPILSANYVFTLLLAYFVLGENLSATKMIGIAIITVSVLMIGGSEKAK